MRWNIPKSQIDTRALSPFPSNLPRMYLIAVNDFRRYDGSMHSHLTAHTSVRIIDSPPFPPTYTRKRCTTCREKLMPTSTAVSLSLPHLRGLLSPIYRGNTPLVKRDDEESSSCENDSCALAISRPSVRATRSIFSRGSDLYTRRSSGNGTFVATISTTSFTCLARFSVKSNRTAIIYDKGGEKGEKRRKTLEHVSLSLSLSLCVLF